MARLKLGYAPTRRFCFSKEDAHLYKRVVLDFIKKYDIDVIDIDDINDEGLVFDSVYYADRIIEKFKAADVDAVFIPHCNFGTEDMVARICRAVGKPVLLWGPRDEDPLEDGMRLRDTQCGLFATGKILRRFGVKFTYIPNCRVDDPLFARGFENFLAVANVVKQFIGLRILQIAPRPAGFWTMIVSEGELLEKFNIQIIPITMTDLELKMKSILEKEPARIADTSADIRAKINCEGVDDETIAGVASMKLAILDFAQQNSCKAAAIQCWNSMQDKIKLMPCLVNGLLTDEGLPVTCETDIHGAITSIMASAACFGKTAPFFADLTVRNAHNDNSELLFHCGNFPPSLAKGGCGSTKFTNHWLFDSHCPGSHEGEIKGGNMSIVRFDGDNGEYSLFLGRAKGCEGKYTRGTYVWIEVNDWLEWEEKLVTGPYVHHCVGIHADIIPVLYEACKYIGIKADLVDPKEDEVKAWLRGSI